MHNVGVIVLAVGAPDRIDGAVRALREHACEVRIEDDAKLVSDRCDESWPDVVVLDVARETRLAALEALDWLRRSAMLPVLALTEPDDVEARLRSIALQCDDAMSPVDPREVVARVAVLVRRRRARGSMTDPLGDLSIDSDGRRAMRRGRWTALTHRELQVLLALTERPGRVVSKEALLDRVWAGRQRSVNAVEAQISALRRKLHELGPPVIHTAHGEGYVFRPSIAEQRDHSHLLAERERLVREREEAVARRTRLLRETEEQYRRSKTEFDGR